MKILHPSQRGFGFTFPDVVLVLLAVILLVLFPPGLRLRQPYTDQRSHCVSNLKQVGLALLYSANDNGNKLKR